MSEKVELFWGFESLGIGVGEDPILANFEESVKYNGERYVAKLPWNDNKQFLRDHRSLAAARLESTTRSAINKGRLKEYDEVLKDQVKAVILEEVPDHEVRSEKFCHYTPHHAVIREDKATTKMKVVLDGAARSAKFHYSINDCLSKGPNLRVSLFETLLRFRLFQVTVLADIELADIE